ncbi:hypothetical protein [Natronobacterium texcoconense]|uniref:Phospholipase_D-nuclease N-terminal n=1 Tax=Natronobacterium texcoconense TaxID=1095778 RepID=A0A1H1IMN2_NATTX|nr:hypothetical protein [Natronobacterium texcoconense]SDR38922.1 hypothetical protein SAMN04489842_3634 [Natronobacterium texcoconense]
MIVALLIVVTFLWLCVGIWAGYDAKTNSSHNALLWGLTVFFGGIVGLLLYVNLGRDRVGDASAASVQPPELLECPNCHAMEEADRDVCRFCETPLEGT